MWSFPGRVCCLSTKQNGLDWMILGLDAMLEGLKVYIHVRWDHICSIVGRDMYISNTHSTSLWMDLDFLGHNNFQVLRKKGYWTRNAADTFHPRHFWTFDERMDISFSNPNDWLSQAQGWTKMMHTRILGIVDYQHRDCECINNLNILEY